MVKKGLIKNLIFNLVNLKTKNVKGCLYKSNINFIESGLDINQCHLWTEHQAGEWIRHLPDWGNYYAAKFL